MTTTVRPTAQSTRLWLYSFGSKGDANRAADEQPKAVLDSNAKLPLELLSKKILDPLRKIQLSRSSQRPLYNKLSGKDEPVLISHKHNPSDTPPDDIRNDSFTEHHPSSETSLPSTDPVHSSTTANYNGYAYVPLHLRLPMPKIIRNALISRIGHGTPNPITFIETSWDPRDTVRSLKKHQWGLLDGRYVLLALLGIFSLCIIESPGPAVKFTVASGILLSLIYPVTRQFFLPFLPIASWLIFFFSCRFIPAGWRPPIWVRVLPTVENILYGANLSNILSKHTNHVLDVLAWLPYGIIHFGAPFVVSLILFIFSPPGTVPIFAQSFGYMNLAGVFIQLLFPCSPPWYENRYGLAPATYDIPGSPGGLARIDQLFGTATYTSTFTASPMVFGAFPSLHSASATIEALFLAHAFPKLQPYLWAYVLWIWWATMYLTHHYFVDLIGGSCLAVAVYYCAQRCFLPQIQFRRVLRWEYEYVVRGDSYIADGSKELPTIDTSVSSPYDLEMGELSVSNDEWSIGSASTSLSGNVSPSSESASMGSSLWDGDAGPNLSDSRCLDGKHHSETDV